MAFFYVIIVGCDELASLANRWFYAPSGLTVAEFSHESFVDPPSPFYPADPGKLDRDRNTDRVELRFKLLNDTKNTVLIERVELDLKADGVVPAGMKQTSKLEVSGEYSLPVPDLQPGETATRYVSTPHVLKPSGADYFVVSLVWPSQVHRRGFTTLTLSACPCFPIGCLSASNGIRWGQAVGSRCLNSRRKHHQRGSPSPGSLARCPRV